MEGIKVDKLDYTQYKMTKDGMTKEILEKMMSGKGSEDEVIKLYKFRKHLFERGIKIKEIEKFVIENISDDFTPIKYKGYHDCQLVL